MVAQRLRIHLAMQTTLVQSLVGEDPTCCGASKPVCHNCWAHLLPSLMPTRLEPVLHNRREVTVMRSPGTATESSPC